ncbi:hypothetical protein [Amycolatopsis sp. NPDC051371]
MLDMLAMLRIDVDMDLIDCDHEDIAECPHFQTTIDAQINSNHAHA